MTFLLANQSLIAQQHDSPIDSVELLREGERYLAANTTSLSRYEQRWQHIQRRLLHRLARREKSCCPG